MDSLMKTALEAQDMFPVIRVIEGLEAELTRLSAELQGAREKLNLITGQSERRGIILGWALDWFESLDDGPRPTWVSSAAMELEEPHHD